MFLVKNIIDNTTNVHVYFFTNFCCCKFYKGVPKGVINVVYGVGPRAGEAIVAHPRIPLVSFTGGTVTARKLRMSAAPYCKKLSLEVIGTLYIYMYCHR